MPTNAGTLLRRAVFNILNADTTMQALCARDVDVVVPWKTVATAPRPVMAYLRASDNATGGSGDARRVAMLLAAFAEGDGALDTAEALVQRSRELLTATAFEGQGLRAWVVWPEAAERTNDPEDTPTTPGSRVRVDLDLPIRVAAPQT
jgi:hypothetical protein